MQHQQTPARAAYDGTCLIVEDSEFDRERLRRILARAARRLLAHHNLPAALRDFEGWN